MRVTGSRVYSRPAPVPKMPAGLVELMEGLTRDVLKNNPPDVYEFCADHMWKLMEIRDGPSNKRTLSLDQKISRAQEMVKKRAEERWQKLEEEHHEKAASEIVDDKTSLQVQPQLQAAGISVGQSVLKPVHQDHDLTQTSELEISCETGNGVIPEKLANEKIDVSQINILEDANKSLREEFVSKKEEIHDISGNKSLLYEETVHQELKNHNEQKENLLSKQKIELVQDKQNVLDDQKGQDEQKIYHEQKDLHHQKVQDGQLVLYVQNEDNGRIENEQKYPNDQIQDKQEREGLERKAHKEEIQDKQKIHGNQKSQDEQKVQGQLIVPDEQIRSETIDDLQTYSEAVQIQRSDSENDNDKKNTKRINEEENKNNEYHAHVPKAKENEKHTIISEEVSDLLTKENETISKIQATSVPALQEISQDSIDNIKSTSLSDQKGEILKSIKTISAEVDPKVEINSSIDDSINTETENPNNSVNVLDTGLSEGNAIEKQEGNEIIDIIQNKTDKIADIELPINLENATDLEQVLNEAIENIKRKDSSANNSFKDAVNEEESDESENSNNTAMSLPKEQKSNVNNKENNSSINALNGTDLNLTPTNTITDSEPKELERSKREVEINVIGVDHSNIAPDRENRNLEKNNDLNNTVAKSNDNEISLSNSDEKTRIENTNGMDLETAAVTIQKVFRTFLFKSRASTFDETVNEDNNLSDEEEKKDETQFLPTNLNKERRPLGISRMDTVLQTVNEEKSLSLSTDDSSLSSAATTIQAHVRGFLVRNKLNSGKTTPSNSIAISNENEPTQTSMDGYADQNKNKTILNIHIVPEGGNYLSRDESMITSMDLSLDGSPPSSVNLHPLGYNTSERRKLLKREDAVQSVSPPSNNSGKLSEDVDSIKELPINEKESNIDNQEDKVTMASLVKDDSHQETEVASLETTPTNSLTIETIIDNTKTSNTEMLSSPEPVTESPDKNKRSLTKQSSDEMDVVTPFKENNSRGDEHQKLLHSGEFHDAALPTKVSRSDTPVVSEFKNVLVYFLFWNN